MLGVDIPVNVAELRASTEPRYSVDVPRNDVSGYNAFADE